jgi:uncharacterized lipoprotein YajG
MLTKHTALITLTLLALALAPLLTGCARPQEEQPALRVSSGITHFTNLSTTDLTVTDDLTVSDDVTVAGDLTATGDVSGDALKAADLSASDDLTVTDDTSLAGLLILSSTNYTSTTASWTPTVTAYHLDTSGNATITMTACANNGQLLILFGDDSNTITIADSNIRSTDGNAITLGQYDVVILACFDTEWIHVAKSANS